MSQLSRVALAAVASAVLSNASSVAADAAGGLSVTPAVIERTAVRGDATSVQLVNSTSRPLKITVTPRPWTQSRGGAVAPNRHKTLLARVGVDARSFTLAAGGRRVVTLKVKSLPSSGSLYGAIETIGLPTAAAKKNGITAAYRLVSTLRLNPPRSRRRLALRASAPRVSGRSIVVPVRNAGNTVAPITGDVRIKGALGSRTGTVRATAVLPGSTVDLGLGSVKGLPSGTYTVTVSLVQDGKRVLRSSRRLRVR
ncbi:MAG TPA: hypothetical protein VFG42_26170 [Baekduia sp.]|uniref:hypothetical protein n=1 Tax=Baekduia sp. TaxID=2600305 RepID=UPI002D7A2B5A|nr:hypothetical protein [Baekduia sp.]HET6510307.1 hypothetical protein [Baekduia sp.]